MSGVCQDPNNCDKEHVAGMGGTSIHRTPDMVVHPSLDEAEKYWAVEE